MVDAPRSREDRPTVCASQRQKPHRAATVASAVAELFIARAEHRADHVRRTWPAWPPLSQFVESCRRSTSIMQPEPVLLECPRKLSRPLGCGTTSQKVRRSDEPLGRPVSSEFVDIRPTYSVLSRLYNAAGAGSSSSTE